MKLNLSFLAVILLSTLFNIPDSAATENSDTASKSSSMPEYSCQCVAFRLDDVQDQFLVQAQMEIIRTFEKKNASLTIGIIGNFTGNDQELISFLKEKIAASSINENSSDAFLLEVANHGWEHEDFTLQSKEGQSLLMQKTNERIFNILDVKSGVFIPPFDRMNDDTIAALRENHMNYVSANAGYPPSFLTNKTLDDNNATTEPTLNSDAIFHFPSLATTGAINTNFTGWYGNSHDVTFANVNASMHRLGYAVVTLHPQEHSIREGFEYDGGIDSRQIHELELLIDEIRAEGFRIVTISQINKDNVISIPEFSSYSIYAILVVSIALVTWLSTKGYGGISKYFGSRSTSGSF